MIPKPFDEIAEADLARLVQDREQESQALDFKRELPAHDNGAKHEFLADVCAFANSVGGDLLYGVLENDQAEAEALNALVVNTDEELLRLQDWVLNSLEPRVTGVHIRAVPVHGGHIVVVRVPRSWNSPHRVRTNQHFYLREGRRKRQLDMPEIRSVFLRSEGQAERIRNFRADRVGKILIGETPVPLFQGTIGVLHVIPIQPREGSLPIDPTQYQLERRLPVVSGGFGGEFRLNLDGAVSHRNVTADGCGAYTLLFRNGAIEALRVFTSALRDGTINVPSTDYENELLQFFRVMQAELGRLGLGPPYVVMYSLLRARNARLGITDPWAELNPDIGRFDRDVLQYPDLTLPQEGEPDILLKPLFDLVWQSVGLPTSQNYNAQGRWHGRR